MRESKRAKRLARPACAAAMAFALALAVPAAASATPAEVSKNTELTGTSPTSTAKVTGTIHATTLKVQVPTDVAFHIDPGAAKGTNGTGQKRGQFTSPTNYTVTNYSAVDVYAFVSGVSSDDATLVNVESGLQKTPGKTGTNDISAMVGLSDADDMVLGTSSHWLTPSTVKDDKNNRYYPLKKSAHGLLTASTDTDQNTPGGSATMMVYGAVKQGGWAEGDSFSFKPTFKIMTVDPSKN